MACQFGGEFLEDVVRLLGRPGIGLFDHVLQRRDAVVEPDREVERVLGALVLDLVDRLFDLGQLPDERVSVVFNAAAGFAPRRSAICFLTSRMRITA